MLEEYSDVLDVIDLCIILRIGRKKVYEILLTGEIPYKRIGRNYKIRKDAVIEYLKK